MKAVILAAGEGKRMNSELPKVLHEVLGKTMISHVVTLAKNVGVEQSIVVVGHKADLVENRIKKEYEDLVLVHQKEQLGTGHAVMMAKDFFDDEGQVLVLYGDTPLISQETIESLKKYHTENKNGVTVVSTYVNDPTGYGRIFRSDDKIKIIEHKDASEEVRKINEINTGIYLFNSSLLKDALSKLKNDNEQKEYYLTDTLEIIANMGETVSAKVFENEEEFLGINDRIQLERANSLMKCKINNKHMLDGVTIIDLNTTYIGVDVTIQKDTIIYPNTILENNTKIGERCIIGPNSRLVNAEVENNVKIENSVAIDCKIGENTTVGPFAYLRPDSNIGENCRIGDFVEIKNSNIGNNTKVSHLTYIGDADFGKNINVGCGTVVVNYDGKRKNRTIVEDGVFIGCNTNLVSPVKVKKGSYTAAGSTITDEVPENSLAIARCRQSNKTDWKL